MSHSVPGPQPSAAEVLGPVWRREAAELRARESKLRAGDESAVHDYRVVARRLRSNLSGFAPLLDGPLPFELAADLRQAANVMGKARDTQVLADRVGRLLEEESEDVEAGRVRAVLLGELDSTAVRQVGLSLSYLDSAGYDALVRRLDRFADLPPWSADARGAAIDVLRCRLKEEWRLFRRAGAAAVAAPHDAAGDVVVHEARKAAKRVRYVAETLTPQFGRRARRLASAAADVQDLLGTHHDSSITRDFLSGRASELVEGPGSRALLERLAAREVEISRGIRDEYEQLFIAVDRKKLRRRL